MPRKPGACWRVARKMWYVQVGGRQFALGVTDPTGALAERALIVAEGVKPGRTAPARGDQFVTMTDNHCTSRRISVSAAIGGDIPSHCVDAHSPRTSPKPLGPPCRFNRVGGFLSCAFLSREPVGVRVPLRASL